MSGGEEGKGVGIENWMVKEQLRKLLVEEMDEWIDAVGWRGWWI